MKASQKRILYVDDDADDRDLLADAIKLASPAIEVILAENGIKALEWLQSVRDQTAHLPCLIVLDLNMPFLDGRETFEQLRRDRILQTVPVMVFSSSESPADKTLFSNLGVDYFTKPSSITYMGQIVNHMINVCCS